MAIPDFTPQLWAVAGRLSIDWMVTLGFTPQARAVIGRLSVRWMVTLYFLSLTTFGSGPGSG